MTTDPLEQRLRDALEAHAKAVGPQDLDRSREQQVAHATAASTEPRSARWPWRLSVAGLAAAAVVVGGVGIGHLTDSTRTPQADPPAATSETSSTAPRQAPSATASTTRAPAPSSSHSTQVPQPDAPRSSATPPPPPRSSTTPTAPTPDGQTSPGSAPRSSSTAPKIQPRGPRTLVAPKTSKPAARLQVRVAAQPAEGTQLSWNATASGTARSDSPTGGVLGYTVDHGDGTTETRRVHEGCDGAVRPVRFTTGDQEHDYRRAGVFKVRVQVQYCADDGRTESDTGTSTVQIP